MDRTPELFRGKQHRIHLPSQLFFGRPQRLDHILEGDVPHHKQVYVAALRMFAASNRAEHKGQRDLFA